MEEEEDDNDVPYTGFGEKYQEERIERRQTEKNKLLPFFITLSLLRRRRRKQKMTNILSLRRRKYWDRIMKNRQ